VLLDARRESGTHVGLVTAMLPIPEAPHHMLYPIGSIVEHEEKTFVKTGQAQNASAVTLCEHQFAVLQIRKLIQPALLSHCGLRHSQSGKQSKLLRQFFYIISRKAHRNIGAADRSLPLRRRTQVAQADEHKTARFR